MNQNQTPRQEKQCAHGCCMISRCGIYQGIILIILGLFVAVPTIGNYIGLDQNNLFVQNAHVILGACFIGWGAAGIIARLFYLYLKNKNKKSINKDID